MHKIPLVSMLLLTATVFVFAQNKAAQSLREADQSWMKAFAARDLDGTAAACAEDASVLAPNTPIASGREAIRKLFGEYFKAPGFKIEWHPSKVEVAKSGELGYTSGVYNDSSNDASGNPVIDRGKYLTVWKKQKDGRWKVAWDAFSSDLPAK